MNISIDPCANGFHNGATLARELLGDLAHESSLGGWQEAIAWIGGSFNLDPRFQDWSTPYGTCHPDCVEVYGERKLRIDVLDKYGFVTARIHAHKDVVWLHLKEDTEEGTVLLGQLNRIGATVTFGVAA